ncbi:SLC13 family permease [Pseudoclavibacter terrae]|uniref:C4-dicarboxylate ABC transporter n=1 Tax=Pseudoclavibacter terrae TaxID=1530195 RepID=A0A7J5B1A5_9MICO|nr:SLC13 family permease [Pseudoclavibacter terrae]KAB1637660.1 C4-dicarboxylate ABC transporter [Pseudoclavibacter terrae]
MSPELISILALFAMVVIATLRPVNIGILGFIGTFLVGTFVLGLSEKDLLAGFPADLFLTIVGVTYLFAVAKLNGTVDLIVDNGVRMVRGRTALVPWVLFGVATLLTAMGTFPPAAVALVAPVALSFAAKHNMDPLPVGMTVVYGALAGSLSPISVLGLLVSGMVGDTPGFSPTVLFGTAFVYSTLIAILTQLFFSYKKRLSDSRDASPSGSSSAGSPTAGGSAVHGPRVPATGNISVDTATQGSTLTLTQTLQVPRLRATPAQILTLLAIVSLALGAMIFHLDIGILALAAGTLIAFIEKKHLSAAVEGISWSTILLVAGMITYISIVEEAGAIEWVAAGIGSLGSPLIGVLVLCFMAGVVSAFASSTAVIAIAIPMLMPLIEGSPVAAGMAISAVAIAAKVVDVSPFSTNGALVLANAQNVDPSAFYQRILRYSAVIVLIGPPLAWATLVVPFSL